MSNYYLRESEASRYLGYSESYLKNRRNRKVSAPQYHTNDGVKWYSKKDLDNWKEERQMNQTNPCPFEEPSIQESPPDFTSLLTEVDASQYLGFPSNFLHNIRTRNHQLKLSPPKHTLIAKRSFYFPQDLDKWLKENKIIPRKELEEKYFTEKQASTYLGFAPSYLAIRRQNKKTTPESVTSLGRRYYCKGGLDKWKEELVLAQKKARKDRKKTAKTSYTPVRVYASPKTPVTPPKALQNGIPLGFMREEAASSYIGEHPTKLQACRVIGEKLVDSVRYGDQHIYKQSDLDAWVNARGRKKEAIPAKKERSPFDSLCNLLLAACEKVETIQEDFPSLDTPSLFNQLVQARRLGEKMKKESEKYPAKINIEVNSVDGNEVSLLEISKVLRSKGIRVSR